jgi:hypothetical protein
LRPLNSALVCSHGVCCCVAAKFETSRWEIAKKTSVSYPVTAIPDAPSYDFTLKTAHRRGLSREVTVEPPIVAVIDTPTTVSHRNPNMKVTVRSPPYIARRRKNHKRVDAEVPIGKKAVNAR